MGKDASRLPQPGHTSLLFGQKAKALQKHHGQKDAPSGRVALEQLKTGLEYLSFVLYSILLHDPRAE